MSKRVKGMIIDSYAEEIGEEQDMLVVDVSTVDAVTCNQWRLGLAKDGIKALTVKNTLARLALERKGVTGLDDLLAGGPSTLVYGGEDVVELAKKITETAQEIEPLAVKGGAVGGQTLDEAGVTTLSKSPGRAELLSIISGQILSPGANLVGALLAGGSNLASQIKQIADGTAGPNATSE